MANITLGQIHYQQHGREILDIAQAVIPCQGVTAIVGPNGAGKTTLLKVIAGLITQTTFFINTPFRHSIMVLSQNPLLKMSVRGNLQILQDVRPELTSEHIQQTLQSFKLDHLQNQAATKLSSGEKQRLAIARASLIGAQLMILDEPTASLDPQSTLLIESKITELAQLGIHFLIASHDFAQVKRISQNLVFMHDGRIEETSTTASFFTSPLTTSAQEFISLHL